MHRHSDMTEDEGFGKPVPHLRQPTGACACCCTRCVNHETGYCICPDCSGVDCGGDCGHEPPPHNYHA